MAQFDVYKNDNEQSKEFIPFFIDVQSEFLDTLNTRMVIPLSNDIKGLEKLNPKFEVEGQKLTLVTQDMASIPRDRLKHKVDSFLKHRDEIINAIDFMIVGF